MHGTMGGVCTLIAASSIFAHDVLVLTRRLPAGAETREIGTTQPERRRGHQELNGLHQQPEAILC